MQGLALWVGSVGTTGLAGPAVASGLHAWPVEPLGQRLGLSA